MMVMTPEAKVKKKVTEQLKELGAYYFFAFECKSGKNKPTALQDKNLTDISVAGGIACVVNEDNMMDIENILKGTQEMDFPVQYE